MNTPTSNLTEAESEAIQPSQLTDTSIQTVQFNRSKRGRAIFEDEAMYSSSQIPKRKRFRRHIAQRIPIEEFSNLNEPKRKRGRPKKNDVENEPPRTSSRKKNFYSDST